MAHLDLVHEAFAVLENQYGYLTLRGETCCRSCAYGFFVAKYGEDCVRERINKAVYYTAQDADDLAFDGNFRYPFYLGWAGDGNQICEALRATGLIVSWDGNPERRIGVEAAEMYPFQTSREQIQDEEFWGDDEEEG